MSTSPKRFTISKTLPDRLAPRVWTRWSAQSPVAGGRLRARGSVGLSPSPSSFGERLETFFKEHAIAPEVGLGRPYVDTRQMTCRLCVRRTTGSIAINAAT